MLARNLCLETNSYSASSSSSAPGLETSPPGEDTWATFAQVEWISSWGAGHPRKSFDWHCHIDPHFHKINCSSSNSGSGATGGDSAFAQMYQMFLPKAALLEYKIYTTVTQIIYQRIASHSNREYSGAFTRIKKGCGCSSYGKTNDMVAWSEAQLKLEMEAQTDLGLEVVGCVLILQTMVSAHITF